MTQKTGRNEPCWCGSGKKYKYCHYDRDKQDPLKIQEAIIATKKAQKEYCLHPHASNADCKGDIIRAHSIQRNGGLNQIAVNGHVYMLNNQLGSFIKSAGQLEYGLIGINKATTFTGFCNYHDTTTFQPIEQKPFSPSQESAFLLSYRALCRELYSKRFQLESVKLLHEGDRGKSQEYQKTYQKSINLYESGINAGLKDVEYHKQLYDVKLIAADYSDVSYYAVCFDRVPDFMCSSAILLEMDFRGNVLQDSQDFKDLNKRLLQCSFSLIGTDTGGAAIFSWLGANPLGIRFIESLDSYSDDDITHAILRFTFEFFENVAISPKWWESLTQDGKDIIRQRTKAGLDLYGQRSPKCLMDDGARLIEWKVTARSKEIIH